MIEIQIKSIAEANKGFLAGKIWRLTSDKLVLFTRSKQSMKKNEIIWHNQPDFAVNGTALSG